MAFPGSRNSKRRSPGLGRAIYPAVTIDAPVATIVSVESLTSHSVTLTFSKQLLHAQPFANWHVNVFTGGIANAVTFVGTDGFEATATCTNVVDPPSTITVTNPSAVVFNDGSRTTDNTVHDVPP